MNKQPGIEFPSEVSGLFHKYHDRILADDSLSDLDVVLVSLYLTHQQKQEAGASYEEARTIFVSLGRREDNFRKRVHLARKEGLIEEKDRTFYFLIDGLKRVWKILGQVQKTPVFVIKSGQSFTAVKLLEEFLMTEIKSEEILLCDPYVSPSTLFPFSVLMDKVKSLVILTSNIYDSDKFEDYRHKMEKETGISVEVKTNNKIHDRYLISGDRCWSIGTSLKDLGKKDTTIREISEVTSSMKELFEERRKEWNTDKV